MKIAILSDIHGNYWALSRVLKDVEVRKPDLIVDLGDSLYGPLKPNDTFELLKSYGVFSLSGNQDRAIIEGISDDSINPTMQYTINDLNDSAVDWLWALPQTQLIGANVYAFHGTPCSDTTYLLEDLQPGFRLVNEESVIESYLTDIEYKHILCGHSHTSRLVQTTNRFIVNPGSVGLQAYDDDAPVYHKMESFSNLAKYCMVEIHGDELIAEQISVRYDYEKAVQCAVGNNRLDWAKWLKYGRV